MRRIVLPRELQGWPLIVSISAGKDSTAAALALKEAGISFIAVSADTGWEENKSWQSQVAYLAKKLEVDIDIVRALNPQERALRFSRKTVLTGAAGPSQEEIDEHGGFVAWSKYKAGFPLRAGRWCTELLKLEPLQAYHERKSEEFDADTASVVGIRAEESDERAEMPELEFSDEWNRWIWRPIRDWTVAEVLEIHHRHGVDVHPLYREGHNRVGCYPCIMANKEEIALVAKNAPERIERIAELEREFTAERARRNAAGEGRFEFPIATFFQPKDKKRGVWPIERVVEWSRTDRGGKQLPMFEEAPRGGCFRWGLCERPPKNEGGGR